MLYKIIVKDLVLYGYHGVLDEERKSGQDFLFNIDIDIDTENESLASNDSLERTLNYSDVITLVKKINSLNKFRLLETFSEVLANRILAMSPIVDRVRVRIEKPSPPIKEDLKSVGVEFEVKKKRQRNSKKDPAGENFSENLVYLSLGSNLGDREKNLRDAVRLLERHYALSMVAISSIYETEPMYMQDQNFFYNIVLSVYVGKKVTPFEFLGFLKWIEFQMGRKKVSERYGPRIIDIDILYYGDLSIDTDFLTIPHPGIKERNFVLTPLSEICPSFTIEGENIKEFIKR
ncbi:MAG: 2-amino-4-hydroxy-6-hydroxymethyldihydropteridine diphosphokinase, partial [Actinobacteria bacterium]|nr:2-amino-4-hydroxy-6-hydroxymethyldihydropteridine diphosphokinase [Actinomycetota bacterium]